MNNGVTGFSSLPLRSKKPVDSNPDWPVPSESEKPKHRGTRRVRHSVEKKDPLMLHLLTEEILTITATVTVEVRRNIHNKGEKGKRKEGQFEVPYRG